MRLRIFILFCLPFLLLTGWGHLGPKVKVGLSLDHTQGREPLIHKLKEALEDNQADFVLGHTTFDNGDANDPGSTTSASNFNLPGGLAFDPDTSYLYVADIGNNR